MKVQTLLVVLVATACARQPKPTAAVASSSPTFARDVAPILYKNCASCHHAGGMAPFSVTDYAQVAPRAEQIRARVASGAMPPWHSDDPSGTFVNDRRLSDAEKSIILRWVDGGAKRGDLADLPAAPQFPSEWSIGTPDAVVAMQEAYPVPASGTIDYQYFQVPTAFTEDKWVQAIEIEPGAREVVHHALVFASAPAGVVQQGSAAARAAQAALVRNAAWERESPPPPRRDSAHAPPRNMGALIAIAVPGNNLTIFPPGTALLVRKGTVLTLQMHYTAHGHAMADRTRIGFKFASGPPQEQIYASEFMNRQFTLPAGAKDVAVPAEIGFNQAVRIWALAPHTHLRGTRWQYVAQLPDGSSRVILNVPHYDFNWQTFYRYAKPIELPAGSKILSTAWYDNSTSNPSNPNPAVDVHWGDQTWEEMQFTGFLYSVVSRPAGTGGRQ